MDSETFDFIVVGAGSAGAAVAARLSESGKLSVLCLEAGKAGSDFFWSRVPAGVGKLIDNATVNWCYDAEPDEGSGGRRIPVPRGKMLGGSSSINGMVFVRGQAQDFDHWAQLGNRGWAYRDVLPFFKKMESFAGGSDEFRGRDGVLKVTETPRDGVFFDSMIEAAEAIGIPFNPDYNGATQEGVAMTQATISRGRRQSTAAAYLDGARQRANLKIETGALASRLILENNVCQGIRYTVDGEPREARASREVIVCGGTINSPQLLELSGIGQGERLRELGIDVVQDLPGVGENLRDHYTPRMRYAVRADAPAFSNDARGWRLGREAVKYVLTGKGFLATPTVPIRIYFRSREGLETPDVTVSALAFLYEIVGTERRISAERGITVNTNVLRPDSVGSVHIASAEASAAPQIRFNFLSASQDRDGLLAGMRKSRELMAAAPMARLVDHEMAPGDGLNSDDELLDWARNHAETTYHPVGTCKMGSDPMAVVDDRLRVHGLGGLRVADASIMPTLTSGNTNAPSIMIGEKCAEMVLGDEG